MLGGWGYAVLALVLVVGGVDAVPRMLAAQSRSEAFDRDALVHGAAASIKRSKEARVPGTAVCGGVIAALPAPIVVPAGVRTCVIEESEAPLVSRAARPCQAAPARAPPARA